MTSKIITVGSSEFCLGFRLAGIQTIVTKSPKEKMEKLFGSPETGIIITDEKTMNELPLFFRETVESKIKPVTVVVSSDAISNETLRKKIKKAIGVDLWSQKGE